jgi:predicted amidohydrolase YtcJ
LAIHPILKAYANQLKAKNDLRWRIEHAQVVQVQDLHYFKEFDIIPSIQPTHATSDMYWAGDRLGKERIKTAYAYKDLLNNAQYVAIGSDFPVEHINPFYSLYAAVARKDKALYPSSGFQTENALSREEAIKGMTIWAAQSIFKEKEIGSLEQGKRADFIVLDQDVMECDESLLFKTQVVSTYKNGKLVHSLQ